MIENKRQCPYCKGGGFDEVYIGAYLKREECDFCKGKGKIPIKQYMEYVRWGKNEE